MAGALTNPFLFWSSRFLKEEAPELAVVLVLLALALASAFAWQLVAL